MKYESVFYCYFRNHGELGRNLDMKKRLFDEFRDMEYRCDAAGFNERLRATKDDQITRFDVS